MIEPATWQGNRIKIILYPQGEVVAYAARLCQEFCKRLLVNLRYVLPRLIRHFMTDRMTRFCLRHHLLIKPGLETSEPQAAVSQYADVLAQHGRSLDDKRVLVFGYGGRFAIGIEFLRRGAAHVVLCDRFAPPDEEANYRLLLDNPDYLREENRLARPNPSVMSLFQADIEDVVARRLTPPVDMVVSTSVYEHLPKAGIDGITAALASLTKPDGIHVHFVDLRDHFFKYPFEMLTFSETVWRNWLNPGSNLNRFRFNDYRRVFENHFADVSIDILERDDDAFENARVRIHPEFMTGELHIDSATLVRIVARHPYCPPLPLHSPT